MTIQDFVHTVSISRETMFKLSTNRNKPTGLLICSGGVVERTLVIKLLFNRSEKEEQDGLKRQITKDRDAAVNLNILTQTNTTEC